MAAHALRGAGRDPAFLIGGELRSAGTNAAWGAGDWAVIEADESDRSFLELAREVAVVTNIELDHHSTYASLAELERAFAEFAAPAELRVVGPGGRAAAGEALRVRHRRAATCGAGPRAAPRRLALRRSSGARVELRVPGRHNVLNALAALAACRAAGVRARRGARPALADFTGAGRRFEEHGRTAGGRARLRRLRPPPDRGARHAGGRAHARRRAGAWSPASSRTSTRARERSRASSGARWRSPTWWWCSTSTRRASAPRTSPA